MTTALRALAVVVALAAVIDPVIALRRPRPPVVDVRAVGPDDDRVAGRVRDHVPGVFNSSGSARRGSATADMSKPDAVVLIGSAGALGRNLEAHRLPPGTPISHVDTRPRSRMRLLDISAPAVMLPGASVEIEARVEMDGRSTDPAIVLEQEGVRLARTPLKADAGGGSQPATVRYTPSAAGLNHLRVVATDGAAPGEQMDAVDIAVLVEERRLRVMTYEPRPSWAAAFIRRAVEDDPIFAPATLARASTGIDVRGGAAPARLTGDALSPFDAVIVGAPEALSQAEVSALEQYARVRGGAVVLVPDRRPSGAYVRLLGSARFDEVLMDVAAPVDTTGPRDIRNALSASEFALPAAVAPGTSVLATTGSHPRARPVILSQPFGPGRVIFSGALDAWRFRGRDSGAFAKFWAGIIASAAAASPRPLEVSAAPSIAAPGERVAVRASVRATEFVAKGERIEMPTIRASLVDEAGAATAIRLWPATEPGLFEGIANPPRGRVTIRVEAGGRAAEVPVEISDGAVVRAAGAEARLRVLTESSGGVAVHESDLEPLSRHLRSLIRADARVSVRPMQSAWWMVVFTAAICAEWLLRRRRGLR